MANRYNTNAVKPKYAKALDYLHCRVHLADKKRWKAAARKSEMRMTPWIVKVLNAEAENELGKI
jgi:hypothetical protein